MTTWNNKETKESFHNLNENPPIFINPHNQKNFKELFENLYVQESKSNKSNTTEKENITEGFNFFDDFDMHRKPKKTKSKGINAILDVLKSIADYILCPVYKSDELIDSGIQNLLAIFLEAKCSDSSLNFFDDAGEKASLDTLDMSDLIDPNLLYTDASLNDIEEKVNKLKDKRQQKKDKRKEQTKEKITDSFQNIEQSGIQEPFETDCAEKEKAKEDIKLYSGIIKEEIYKILFLPVIIHIFFNVFYMFFYRDILGNIPHFIDIEEQFYDPYLKPYLDYFLGIFIKPVAYLSLGLNMISSMKWRRKLSDEYPHWFYIILFFIGVILIEYINDNLLVMISGLPNSRLLFGFALVVMVIEFFKKFVQDLFSWIPTLTNQPISGGIKFIIYWVIKIVVNILLYRFASSLCGIYLIVYMFFGIYISQNEDVFVVYGDIMDMVFDKIYKIFDPRCETYSFIKMINLYFCKYVAYFMFEIALIYFLSAGMSRYIRTVNNVNVQSFLCILNITAIIIVGFWILMKYKTGLLAMDKKYDIANSSKKAQTDKAKNERVNSEKTKKSRDDFRKSIEPSIKELKNFELDDEDLFKLKDGDDYEFENIRINDIIKKIKEKIKKYQPEFKYFIDKGKEIKYISTMIKELIKENNISISENNLKTFINIFLKFTETIIEEEEKEVTQILPAQSKRVSAVAPAVAPAVASPSPPVVASPADTPTPPVSPVADTPASPVAPAADTPTPPADTPAPPSPPTDRNTNLTPEEKIYGYSKDLLNQSEIYKASQNPSGGAVSQDLIEKIEKELLEKHIITEDQINENKK